MQEWIGQHPNLTVIRNAFNTKKVGAIERMAHLVKTPFVFTLDADCSLLELQEGAVESLMARMERDDIAASCFRIIPNDKDWLGKLQKLDYSIFSDALRKLLQVPVCLIGQGVMWRTSCLLKVLSEHSREYDGDDLENTTIALSNGMRIYWEPNTIIVRTEPKRTVTGLLKQRALSWDYGMVRVLLTKQAILLGGESGAFYKNILLIEVVAHVFKLMAIPFLFSLPMAYYLRFAFYDGVISTMFRNSVAVSLRFGVTAIFIIWALCVVNSLICVRRVGATLKWAVFSALNLASPFVYFVFFPLLTVPIMNAYDTVGAAIHWLGLGLFLTYIWWVALTLVLLVLTSLDLEDKTDLIWSAFLAPLYYFALLVICKSVGIAKYVAHSIFSGRKQPVFQDR
jgi:hypothetical protein